MLSEAEPDSALMLGGSSMKGSRCDEDEWGRCRGGCCGEMAGVEAREDPNPLLQLEVGDARAISSDDG